MDRIPTEPLTSSSWTTYLSQPIRTFGKIKIKLLEIEMPNVFYTFPFYGYRLYFESQNTIIYQDIPTDRIFVDGQQFVAYMNPLLISKGVQLSYNDNTARLTITNNRSSPIRLVSNYRYSDRLDDTPSNANDRLGFIYNYTGTSILPQQSYTAEAPLRLLRTNCVYLCSNIINGQATNQTIIPSPYKQVSNILSRVSSGNFGSLSQISIPNEIEFAVGSNTISSIQWTLLDEEYEEIYTPFPITFSVLISQ